ncbi:MAG: TPM domain-containing protein, partial [Ferruginibacter sp.]
MKKIISILVSLLLSVVSFSQSNFDPESLLKQAPAKQVLVNDFTGTLTQEQKDALERKLVAFDDSTSNQIAVVIIPSLNGNDIADYNVRLFRAWKVGNKKTNNGVVLLIAKQDRKLNITTGYGLEGALPDITCKEIIDAIIVPQFKGNDYYRGIDKGVTAIMQAVKGEYVAPQGYNSRGKKNVTGKSLIIIILII